MDEREPDGRDMGERDTGERDGRDAALAFDGVTKRYGTVAALDGVRLSVARGTLLALVGASGSGKTTLLKSANRLVVPDAGTVRVDGRDIADRPPAELRRSIGYVIQTIGLMPHLTVAENIALVPRLDGWSAEERRERVTELLGLVSLPADFARRRPAELSGGQAQRVGVARALAARPTLMLMDEPFGALDPVTRDELGRACRALHDRLGLTTVMVTHDVTEALLLADRVVVLGGGRVLADATPAGLMRGGQEPEVAALLAVPRDQAARLRELGA